MIYNPSQFVISQRSARIQQNGIKLESKFGSVSLELKDFYYCQIKFKKISGNGKVLINNQPYQIYSQLEQCIEIIIPNNNQIEITRPKDGLGEVLISQIILENQNLLLEWKKLSKLVKYSGLRVISNDKLYATQFASIENADCISSLQTEPPNLFIIENNVYKFLLACEIIELQLKDQQPYLIAKAPFVARQIATENSFDLIEVTDSRLNMDFSQNHKIILDSSINNNLNKNYFSVNTYVKFLKSNNQDWLILKNKALAVLPVQNLKINTNYLITLSMKRLNGHGKFKIGLNYFSKLSPPITAFEIQANLQLEDKNIVINTGDISAYPGEAYGLAFQALDGMGEVLISKINVAEQSVNIDSSKNTDKSYLFNYTTTVTINDNFFEGRDQVEITMKKFAKLFPTVGYKSKFYLNDSLNIKSFIAFSWFNKINNLFPNLKNSNNSSLAICTLDNLSKNNSKIFLEPFKPELLTRDKIDQLVSNGYKYIFTSSYDNYDLLNNHDTFNFINIIFLPRILPWVDNVTLPKYFLNKSYGVMLHRCNDLTQKVLDCYDSHNPKLVLFGARGKLPNFVIPVHQYNNYSQSLAILQHSKFLLDFNSLNDYHSSWLDLASQVNLPIITNNSFIKNNVYQFDNSSQINELIIQAVAKTFQFRIPSDQNQRIADTLQLMLGLN